MPTTPELTFIMDHGSNEAAADAFEVYVDLVDNGGHPTMTTQVEQAFWTLYERHMIGEQIPNMLREYDFFTD